ncbi:hypothetical protein F383_38056 [Gossypium arboreum]|uniref:Uncharacterized protein n=1 Tax=Gossypium arboreum TaxID=29729 RepID=A0A0B0M9Z3_GOSAR|nr:hypothetical protein F383_38056 [Gossypium arboreum]
MPLSQTGSYM